MYYEIFALKKSITLTFLFQSYSALAKHISSHPNCTQDNSTAAFITPFAEEKSKEIFKRKDDYYVLRYSQTDWLVMHKNGRKIPLSNKDQSKVSFEDCFNKPSFTNVYKVTLCNLTKRMKCSCCTVIRIGMPCQHIYAVIQERTPDMFHVRWYIIYNSLKVDVSDEVKQVLENLRTEHYKCFNSVYIGTVFEKLPIYIGLSLCMSGQTASDMLSVYICHLHGKAVRKSNRQMALDFDFSFSSHHREFEQLNDYILSVFYDSEDQNKEHMILPAISDESHADHIVSRANERTKSSTLESDMVRYHKLMDRFRHLAKIGEGRPDLYEEMLLKLDELTIDFTQKAIANDGFLQKEQDDSKQRRLVSSNASTECVPNRGRYKGSHERK